MKLVHYANKNKPLTKIEYREQTKGDFQFFKPTGLWVSDDDDFGWKDWCINVQYNLDNLELAYEITLMEHHNIQIIFTAEGIRSWSERYPYFSKTGLGNRLHLDWPRIREEWDGLIITPYQESMHIEIDHLWYNTWDCASGCIWNPAVIKSFDICQKSRSESESIYDD